ncbi:polymorphic toxin-type HINT domain-containing protein [Streptomyces sp. NBC_00659]|nr:polymorphic toxin-type HINT domain-containing protein [Streptomyces sp. NBC_00659]
MTEAWAQSTTACAATPATGVLGGPAPYWNSYTYDKTGNRLTETQHGTTTGASDTQRDYHYPDPGAVRPHALGSVDTTTGSVKSADSFGYDAVGNTHTRLLANGSSQTLDWDAESHLAKVTEPVTGGSDKVTEYLYDADGNRLIGRFLSVDPLMTTSDPQTLNAYAYANNSPVTSSDPSGLCMADQCGIGYPIGGTGTNGHKKEYVKKAPRGAGGVGTNSYLGAGYTGKLPDAANGDSNNVKKSEKDGKWYVQIYPSVWMEADNPHVDQVAANFQKWAKYVCDPFNEGNDTGCLAPRGKDDDPNLYQRVKAKLLSCDSDWDCGDNWANPNDLMSAGVESGMFGPGDIGQMAHAAGKSLTGQKATGEGRCSFDPDTPVLMEDGKSKPIGKVEPGDRVESGDPQKGKHRGSRTVTAQLVNHDDDLTDVQVKDADGKTLTLHTTSRHPFWDDTTHSWVPAGKLKPGHTLNTATDKHVRITTVKARPGTADMYNLTVNELHTYYVLAGATPVLVHNMCPKKNNSGTPQATPIPRPATYQLIAIRRGNGTPRLDDAGNVKIFEGRKPHERPYAGFQEYAIPNVPEDKGRILYNPQTGEAAWPTNHYTTIQRFPDGYKMNP